LIKPGFCSGRHSGRSVKKTTHLYLETRLRMRRATTPLSLKSSRRRVELRDAQIYLLYILTL
jgi:hypothetical protein